MHLIRRKTITENSDRKNIYIRGPVFYAMITGAPRLNYNKDGNEWSLEVGLNEKSKKILVELGEEARIKNKEDERGDFIRLKQSEFSRAGKQLYPPKVIDINDQPWPEGKKIGNNSICDVKLTFVDNGKGKKNSLWLNGLRVLELVEYNNNSGFAPIGSDDEFFKVKEEEVAAKPDGREALKEMTALGEDLDDDVPF